MEYSLDFIVVDLRKNKERNLAKVEGLKVYSIDPRELIETIEAQFNENFMEARGREHFLFLLNKFSFEDLSCLDSEEFFLCSKLIRILNSYSYCYLSILEGGESAYSSFIHELSLKSELLNSKLMPVSEFTEEEHQNQEQANHSPCLVGKESFLEVKEIVTLQQLYESRRLFIFEGS